MNSSSDQRFQKLRPPRYLRRVAPIRLMRSRGRPPKVTGAPVASSGCDAQMAVASLRGRMNEPSCPQVLTQDGEVEIAPMIAEALDHVVEPCARTKV